MTRWHLSPRFSNGSSLAPQRPIIIIIYKQKQI